MSWRELIKQLEIEMMNDPQIQRAVQELKEIVLAQYPDARFEVAFDDEPFGVYITAIVDVEDTEDVSNLYLHRLIEMQVEEDLPIHIYTSRRRAWERRIANEKKYRQSA